MPSREGAIEPLGATDNPVTSNLIGCCLDGGNDASMLTSAVAFVSVGCCLTGGGDARMLTSALSDNETDGISRSFEGCTVCSLGSLLAGGAAGSASGSGVPAC